MENDIVFVVQRHRLDGSVFIEHISRRGGSSAIIFNTEKDIMYVSISPARAKEWIRLLNESILRAE